MPWLTGTAFLHSVMMQEKRGMMRVWNVWLVFTTFLLTIFGTFLTRSGVVNSVHAFAQSRIGPWFLGFIGFVLLVCFISFWRNRDYLRSDNTLDSLVSRESSFLFNNLILLVACVAVISGTLFPVLSEWVRSTKISVGVPFFNMINLPIGLFLLFLTGVGPYRLTHQTFDSTQLGNYTSERATIAVDRGGKQIIMLYPEKRFYPSNQESGTMVAIYSTLKEDLYVVYAGHSPDTQQPVIHAYLNPLVKWIWLGGAIVVLGTLLALMPNRQPMLALRTAVEPSRAAPALSPSPAPIQHYDGHD